jgi:Spy/CpxP family protein refolding chaperone
MKQTLLATILLGLLILPLGAQSVSETPHGRELPFNFAISNDVAREVGITDAQMKQFSNVLTANRRNVQELRDEVGKKESDLQAILDTGTVDLAQAEKAVDAVLEARNRLAKTQTMMTIQLRLILSGDQWHNLVELQRKSMTYSPSMTPPVDPSQPAWVKNESSAIATMRTLNTAEVVFASTYKKGFTDGLNRMGQPTQVGTQPDENHADLVDPILSGIANGGSNLSFIKNGYRFTFIAGPGAFGSLQAYTVLAQPLEYGVSGKRSFYTDQHAIVRETSDNRQATANDPSITGR